MKSEDESSTHSDSADDIERVAAKIMLQIEGSTVGCELIELMQQQVDAAVRVRLVRLDRRHRVHIGDFAAHDPVYVAVSRAEQIVVRDPWVAPRFVPFALGIRRRHAVEDAGRCRVVDAVHLGTDADDFVGCRCSQLVMSISGLKPWKKQVPPPQCASMSYCSKSPCQILARYQILLHFAEAGPAIEGKDRQNRMCLTINPKQTSAKIVGTVYDMFTMNCKCKPNRIDIRFLYYLHGSDLSSSKRT